MNTSKVQARKMVLVGMFLLAILSVYRDRKESSPQGTFRTFWGVGVVGEFLALLADFAPQIAGPFAGLVVLGSLTNGGWNAINNALGFVAKAPGSGSGSNPSPGPGSSPAGTPAAPLPRVPGPAHSTGPLPNPLTGE